MPYESSVIDRLFVYQWIVPIADDAGSLNERMKAIRAARGKKAICLSIVPPECPVPDGAARRAYQTFARDEYFKHCEHIAGAFEGDGIRAMMLRTVGRGIMTVAGMCDKMSIHASVKDALDYLSPALRVDGTHILDRLSAVGMVTSTVNASGDAHGI